MLPTHADVLIVGSGPAGVAAALAANDAGASWVGVEAGDELGGTALLSGGGCCFGGTSTQRAAGIDDSPERALADLCAGNPDVDEAWARLYFERCERDVHDWLTGLGVRFEHLRHQDELAERQSVPRWHQPHGAGRALMATLHAALASAGARGRFHTEVRVVALVGDGAVTGARLTHRGITTELRAKAVVMATGGFGSDPALLRRHSSAALLRAGGALCGGGPGAKGDGHRLLAERDASLVHMDHLWCYLYALADHDDPTHTRGFAVWGIPHNVWVTREAARFHDESLRGAAHAMPAFLRLAEPSCFAILDRRIADGMQVLDPRYRARDGAFLAAPREALLARSPEVFRGPTLEALARAAGLPVEPFVRTMQAWNALLAAGVERDPSTGRSLVGVAPIERPPFYALRCRPIVRKNLGGVRTDLDCRVLDARARPLPGVFAAGELSGFGGGALTGTLALEGMMIGGALFTGRRAGRAAAAEAGFGTRTDATDATGATGAT